MQTNLSDVQIIDDLLPETYSKEILDLFTDSKFPWFYNPNISYLDDNFNNRFTNNDSRLKDTDAFIHGFMVQGQKNSPYFDLIRPVLYFLEQRTQINISNLIRIRGVFVHKNPMFGDYINIPHVDISFPHNTLIYYVNDTDGDTVIFEEKYNGDIDYSKKTIKQTITPKKNRAVLFNGMHYHTGSVPKDNHRLVINFNFS